MPWRTKNDVQRHNKKCSQHPDCVKLWLRVANDHYNRTGDDGQAVIRANVAAKNWLQKYGKYRCNPDFITAYGDYTESRLWPEHDMFRDPRTVDIPLIRFEAGTQLFHGTTGRGFRDLVLGSWFSLEPEPSSLHAYYGLAPGEQPEDVRIMQFETIRPIDLIFFPKSRPYGRDERRAAVEWLKAKFGASFDWVGYRLEHQVTEAICEAGYDGLFVEQEDSGYPSLMVCRPPEVMVFVGES